MTISQPIADIAHAFAQSKGITLYEMNPDFDLETFQEHFPILALDSPPPESLHTMEYYGNPAILYAAGLEKTDPENQYTKEILVIESQERQARIKTFNSYGTGILSVRDNSLVDAISQLKCVAGVTPACTWYTHFNLDHETSRLSVIKFLLKLF